MKLFRALDVYLKKQHVPTYLLNSRVRYRVAGTISALRTSDWRGFIIIRATNLQIVCDMHEIFT